MEKSKLKTVEFFLPRIEIQRPSPMMKNAPYEDDIQIYFLNTIIHKYVLHRDRIWEGLRGISCCDPGSPCENEIVVAAPSKEL